MNKQEAIAAMETGAKLTWPHFSSDEWVTIQEDGYYLFEDGCRCTPEEFWAHRDTPEWFKDWELY